MPDENRGTGNGPIDPAAVIDAAAEPAARKAGGKKRGPYKPRAGSSAGTGGSASGTAGAKKAKAQLDLSSLTGMFVGVHVLLGMRLNAPELIISEEEGEQFMTRAQAVLKHYSIEASQKAIDWMAFAGVTAGIYVPRAAAIYFRMKSGQHAVMPGEAQGGPEMSRPKPNGHDPHAFEIRPDEFGGGEADLTH